MKQLFRFLLGYVCAKDRHNIFSLLALQQNENWVSCSFPSRRGKDIWTSNLEHGNEGEVAGELTVMHNYFSEGDGLWILVLILLWEVLSWGIWFRKRWNHWNSSTWAQTPHSFIMSLGALWIWLWPPKGMSNDPGYI